MANKLHLIKSAAAPPPSYRQTLKQQFPVCRPSKDKRGLCDLFTALPLWLRLRFCTQIQFTPGRLSSQATQVPCVVVSCHMLGGLHCNCKRSRVCLCFCRYGIITANDKSNTYSLTCQPEESFQSFTFLHLMNQWYEPFRIIWSVPKALRDLAPFYIPISLET